MVVSWVVEFECLPETFYLSLCCRFSNGTEDMFYAVLFAEFCESTLSVVAVVLGSVVAEDLGGDSTLT